MGVTAPTVAMPAPIGGPDAWRPSGSWLAADLATTDRTGRQRAHDNGFVIEPDNSLALFDFREPSNVSDWTAIDDRVMGGVSRSGLRRDPAGHAVFEGTVSLERNGGFASVRSSSAARGKPGAEHCALEVRGSGKHYKLTLITDDNFDTLNYQAEFTPDERGWQTIRLPIGSFRATFRGREVSGAPALDPARIRQVGLMIAGRQAGSFALDIRGIWLA